MKSGNRRPASRPSPAVWYREGKAKDALAATEWKSSASRHTRTTIFYAIHQWYEAFQCIQCQDTMPILSCVPTPLRDILPFEPSLKGKTSSHAISKECRPFGGLQPIRQWFSFFLQRFEQVRPFCHYSFLIIPAGGNLCHTPH